MSSHALGKRKYRSQAEWQDLIEHQVQNGLSGKAYCELHDIGLKSFYRHRKSLRQNTPMVKVGRLRIPLKPSTHSM